MIKAYGPALFIPTVSHRHRELIVSPPQPEIGKSLVRGQRSRRPSGGSGAESYFLWIDSGVEQRINPTLNGSLALFAVFFSLELKAQSP